MMKKEREKALVPEPVPSPPDPEQIKRIVGMAAEWTGNAAASSPAGTVIERARPDTSYKQRQARKRRNQERVTRALHNEDVAHFMQEFGLDREEAEKWAREQ